MGDHCCVIARPSCSGIGLGWSLERADGLSGRPASALRPDARASCAAGLKMLRSEGRAASALVGLSLSPFPRAPRGAAYRVRPRLPTARAKHMRTSSLKDIGHSNGNKASREGAPLGSRARPSRGAADIMGVGGALCSRRTLPGLAFWKRPRKMSSC